MSSPLTRMNSSWFHWYNEQARGVGTSAYISRLFMLSVYNAVAWNDVNVAVPPCVRTRIPQ